MSTPQTRPYTPALYMPGNTGRFRTYPRNVATPIPGAGYDAGMLWAEQELDLTGRAAAYPTGRYSGVPLRGIGTYYATSGLGQATCPTGPSTMRFPHNIVASWGAWPDPSCPGWLYNSNPGWGQLSTSDALLSLKYQVVGVGVAGLLLGYMFAGRRMQANRRRRMRANGHRRRSR
jgi:hypothetical protein